MTYLPVKSVLLLFVLFQSVVAAPEYVTSWPKKVIVDIPDPVLGDKVFWEYWNYSKLFSSKFEGFEESKADPKLSNNIQAIVLRIYKKNLWSRVRADYPKQYACELDVYFDNTLNIPLVERKRKYKPSSYPSNISMSVNRINLKNGKNIVLKNLITDTHIASVSPKVFSIPVDGRYASFGIKHYFKNITPNISMVVLGQGVSNCKITAPLKKNGSHWFSLLGYLPFDNKRTHGGPSPIMQSYSLKYGNLKMEKSNFNFNKGYFQLTSKFHQMVLPKLTLVKALNNCIYKEKVGNQSLEVRNKNKAKWEEIKSRCDDIRKSGIISDPYLYYSREQGLNESGY